VNAGGVRERALSIVRPSIEAMLLAAVALGCVQAGWSVLTPSSAGAVDAASDDDRVDVSFDLANVQSPFAPHAVGSGAASHAMAALVSGIELKGVRLAEDHSRSGAMLLLGEGVERAFLIGDEIAEGVTLADVDPDYILLAYEGGQRRLEMTAAPSYSFARAMLGLERAPGAPEQAEVQSYARAMLGQANAPATDEPVAIPAAAVEAPPPASAQFSAAPDAAGAAAEAPLLQDQQWLASALANVELADGVARGWRIQAPPPAAEAAGLRAGDLVLTLNGVGPANIAQAVAAARSQHLELMVERGGERVRITVELDQRT